MKKAYLTCALAVAACGPAPTENTTAAAPEVRASPWAYRIHDDAMRKERTWIASNEAINPAQLDFPYQGGTTATIQLVQGQKDDPDNQQATLILHNGQIDCSSTCDISLKFDDGEVLESSGTRTDCGEDQCVNLPVTGDIEAFGTKAYQGFHKRIRASKHLTIEVPLYKFGRHQFELDTSGLVWPQPGAPTTGEGSGLADGSKKL